MSEPTALLTSLAFYHAWTGHDFAEAMSYVAEEIVCDAPAGRITGAAAFRDFLEPFSRILTEATLLASFGDDRTALLMYDTVTVPVPHAPGAEWHTVVDGRIRRIRIIFDRAPFAAARAAAR
ncbi:nuclear transport factor 2 family protein [Nocardia araoensis]|uniref:nuclear transport factor 2 family protein n=1 Tax=Nocardia araoensis TaxID=228600 RepID=UPI0002F4FE8D|nr:nuclear transport factor 2 family protein [Nocardia araoensis]